jgi:3-deoxy-D-manno-octulosonic-acid transferase
MAKAQTTLMRLGGRSLARLIRHIARTSDLTLDPPNLHEYLGRQHPVILAMWHGQFMLLPLLQQHAVTVKAMVARHGDAELIGEALRQFDIELIRGAGAGDRKRDRGGATALREAVRALAEGTTVAMTADVPPGPARISGTGIVTLARMTGRPIIAVAAASSRYTSFDTWSRMTLNLPHSKLALVAGEPIFAPRDADEAALEAVRQKIEQQLNRVTNRAYEIVGADISRATPLEHLPADPAAKPGTAINLYRAALAMARPAAPLLLAYRTRQGKEDPARKAERLGIASAIRPLGPLVWVHAASVGETNVALPLIEEILKSNSELSVLLTTGTTTSAALAKARLPKRAIHQYIPLDVRTYTNRFLDHWQPSLAIFTESEIWPNLVLETSGRAIPLALINARMSPRSMRRWRRFARSARPLFARFDVALAQNDRIARMLRTLGARNVANAGNLKIDSPAPPADPAELARLKAAIAGRPCMLAASTHPGEEQIVAEAHKLLRAEFPNLLTIIVPRHPERGADLQTGLSGLGLTVERRSATGLPGPDANIYIADTLGELGTFYALAPVAFIGGSLVGRGGQNPIEAVRHGAVVLTGPSYHNFGDAYAALLGASGAIEVRSAADLAGAVQRLFSDEADAQNRRQRATRALDALSGAMAKTLAALQPYLEQQKVGERAPP